MFTREKSKWMKTKIGGLYKHSSKHLPKLQMTIPRYDSILVHISMYQKRSHRQRARKENNGEAISLFPVYLGVLFGGFTCEICVAM